MKIEIALVGTLILIMAIGIWAILALPSCEDRGGRSVLDHYQPSVTYVGKTPVVTMIPIYRCEGTKE